jgi:phosphoribosylformylglycinamidine (FGAM) synthase PurS component
VTEKARLEHAVAEALQNPQRHEAARVRMRDFVYFQVDGRAAERAAQALAELVGNP